MTKRLLNHQETPHPIRNPWAKSEAQKAELFACHLENIFTPHSDLRDSLSAKLVEHRLDIKVDPFRGDSFA